MLTTGNILMPQMRNPVASSNKPPTALKSAIIDGVVSGNISAAAHASVNWMISNGILITDTAIPSEQAKIIAVKKSRNDLAIKIRHCCKVSDEAAFCLIQRPYISKTLLTRRISPRGSP